jgi:hypothetical protein
MPQRPQSARRDVPSPPNNPNPRDPEPVDPTHIQVGRGRKSGRFAQCPRDDAQPLRRTR